MTEGSREQALAALWFDWDEAYQIEHAGDEWRAKRLDGLGGWFEAGTPGSLRRMIRADYDIKPVPHGVAAPPGEGAGPGQPGGRP
jgi:hypothetical protein